MFIKIEIPDKSSLMLKFHTENFAVGNNKGHDAKVIKYSRYPSL